jgi:rubredoxin
LPPHVAFSRFPGRRRALTQPFSADTVAGHRLHRPCVCGLEAGGPDNGMPPGAPWGQLPDDRVCPACGVGKDILGAVKE